VSYPFSGSVPTSGGAMTGNLSLGAHLQFTGRLPTARAGAAAGTSPPSPVFSAGSNDNAGTIAFGTGTSPGAGVLVVVTFNTAFNLADASSPHVVVNPTNAFTQALGLYVTSPSPTGFSLSCANAPNGGEPPGFYAFSYVLLG
jgi:hypothetical protein